jgi:hypothetical protein
MPYREKKQPKLAVNTRRGVKEAIVCLLPASHVFQIQNYKGDIAKNRYLIEFADTHARKLISVSLNYEQTFYVSVAAMAYWLFARNALFLDDRDAGHITRSLAEVII